MKSFLQKLFNFESKDTKLYNDLEQNKYFKPIIEEIKKINLPQISSFATKILQQLNCNSSNLDKLRILIKEGIPDELASLRSLVWKVNLGYLPLKIDQWSVSLEKNRNEYSKLKDDIYSNLRNNEKICEEEINNYYRSIYQNDQIKSLELHKNMINDDLKSDGPKLIKQNSVNFKKICTESILDEDYNVSKFKIFHQLELLMKISKQVNLREKSKIAINSFIQDCEILDEINKDIRRTRSNMHFLFLPAKSNSCLNNENIANIADIIRNDGYMEDENNSNFMYETHLDVLARILFVYAKNHNNIAYVQGMNELIFPLYYCFLNDNSAIFINDLENDTYFCFEIFMSKIGEIYQRNGNVKTNPINIRLNKLKEYLKVLEEDIYNLFHKEHIEIELFCIRWYALFLAQEFEIPDVLRLWDTLLSEEDYFDYINCLCIALLKIKKETIIKLRFCDILMSLKKLDSIDIEFLLEVTADVKKKYMKIKQNIH